MALFIGGPLDGKFIDVADNRDHVEIATEHQIYNNKITDIFYYKREIIECPTAEIPVYIPRTYTCSDVLEALVKGYHLSVNNND